MQCKPSKTKIITPSPYFKISFSCSNRAFYAVKGDLYDVAEKAGIEINDGYICESCDYEGDLEQIEIYNDESGKSLIAAVLEFYGVDKKELPEGMSVILSVH